MERANEDTVFLFHMWKYHNMPNQWVTFIKDNSGTGQTLKTLSKKYRVMHPECCKKKRKKQAVVNKPKKQVAVSTPMTAPPPLIPLAVATVNAWDGGSKRAQFTEYLSNIASKKPDFIFLQEAPTNAHGAVRAIADQYEISSLNHPTWDTGYERMMTLRRIDSAWRIRASKVIVSEFCDTPRVATLQTFQSTSGQNKTISIANVHLCGGRFDERTHCLNETTLKDAKLDLLSKIVGSADIVLGDFNSDFLAFTQNSTSKLQFLKGLGCSEKNAQAWHDAPYKLMQREGYRPVPMDGPTSMYKTLPDGIWFSDDVHLKGKVVLDALTKKASDHNGIMASFGV